MDEKEHNEIEQRYFELEMRKGALEDEAGQCKSPKKKKELIAELEGINEILNAPELHRKELEMQQEQQAQARRTMGRYSLEDAANFIHAATGQDAKSILKELAAGASASSGMLATYKPGELLPNRQGKNAAYYEIANYHEAYWNDLNDWLATLPRLDCEFPQPDAPAAKVEAVPDTRPSGDNWMNKARAIANTKALEKYARGEREITARNICEAVATELAKDLTTHGIRGERSAGNIRNEALKGWKFIPPNGTNGTSGTKK